MIATTQYRVIREFGVQTVPSKSIVYIVVQAGRLLLAVLGLVDLLSVR